MDNLLIILVIGLALTVSVAAPVIGLFIMRHKDRAELDHYGKYRGSGPAKSFVCPECLTRTYAPSHIARRWCARCEKSFPEKSLPEKSIPERSTAPKQWSGVKPKVWQPDAEAAE